MGKFLQIKNLKKEYGSGTGIVHALCGVDLEIEEGEMLAVTGTSGSGKTTLLQMIGGMDRPTEGSVLFCGEDIAKYSKKEQAAYRCSRIGFVFQDFKLLDELNVRENILLPVLIAKEKPNEAYYDSLIDLLGLSDRQTHLPSELSGGQKQRTAIARALINRPELLLADEPTGNLDHETSAEILKVLKEINAQGKTILLVTHDMEIASECKRVIEIADGEICSGA